MIKELERINELARKQKREGLTPGEKEEQHDLRQAYLRQISGQVLNTFSSLKVVDPLGKDVTPQKLKEEQEKREKNEDDDEIVH